MPAKGKTNMEVRKNNRNRIFRYLLTCERVSNPDIAHELRISLPTVMQNTRELLEQGLILEDGEMDSTGGRRAKALVPAAKARLAAGLDITANHLGLLLSSLTGEILDARRIPLRFEDREDYYEEVSRLLADFLRDNEDGGERLLGVGISVPGIVDQKREEIAFSHILGIRRMPFERISRFFPWPCYFMNDANAGAYAEAAGREKKEPFFYLSLSNTVGGAMFTGSGISDGAHFHCGEAGHMTVVPGGRPCYCGNRGCLDAYCSARILAEAGGGKLESFFERLRKGEPEIRSLWQEYTDVLAAAVHNLYMVLDCDIVLGGYVGSYAEEFGEEIREKAGTGNVFENSGSYVKPCRYRREAAALGAALYVTERFVEQV